MGKRKGFVYSRSLRTPKKREAPVSQIRSGENSGRRWSRRGGYGGPGCAKQVATGSGGSGIFWGRSSPENPLEVLGTWGSVACGLHRPIYLQDGYNVLDTIPNQYLRTNAKNTQVQPRSRLRHSRLHDT